jgi:Rrf2 family protein
MKLSLKVEYACRVLAQLGLTWARPDLPHIDELATAERIPANYLVQILNELRNGGLIVSRRGKQGGYSLARAPREISLYDIICAVDGELLGFSHKTMAGQSAARTIEVWSEVARALEKKTRSLSVEDLITGRSGEMWHI